MAATMNDIRSWLQRAKAQGATHVIVVCDTYDHDDYPVFVMPGEDVREKQKEYDGKNMAKIMEVYSMKLDIEAQLRQVRAFNYD